MIFEPIRRRWAEREMKKSISERSVRYDGVLERVVILCNAAEVDPFDLRKKLASEFTISPVHIDIVVCNYVEDRIVDQAFFRIDHKLIGRMGGLKNEGIKDLLKVKYDLQINYSENPPFELCYLSAALKAGVKAGVGGNADILNDLQIDMPLDQPEQFTKELKKYLSILKKK